MNIYLDNAATTKLHPKVLEAMLPFLKEEYGNPSAIHSFGRKTRVAIEESREVIANFIGADPSEIYYTSGGTEANNFVINGLAKEEFLESGKNNLITTSGDHKAVLNAFQNLEAEGFTSTILKLNPNFSVCTDTISDEIKEKSSLVSIVHVNNETGKINSIDKLKAAFPYSYIHTDAVQSFGKIRIDVNNLRIDALSVSAHKFHGPKGIGMAYVKSGTPMRSLIIGGGQERNRRAGTENVAGIVGFAEAVKLADKNIDENFEQSTKLKNYLWNGLFQNINGIKNNSEINSSPYILSFTFDPDIYLNDSEAMLMFLDINGIAASSGSACTSGTLKPSHVILAGGFSENYAKGTLRLSFSSENTFEEIDRTIEILTKLSKQITK